MIIYFNTGESFKYLNAITVNQETFEGEARPSIEVIQKQFVMLIH